MYLRGTFVVEVNMSAMVATHTEPTPAWLDTRIGGLTAAGRSALSVWLLRAATRDARLLGLRPLVARPTTVAEGLWSLSEGLGSHGDTHPGIMARMVASGDLSGAAGAWVGMPLDGPAGPSWRVDVMTDLLTQAEYTGQRVTDKETGREGTVMTYLPAQQRGWRTFALFTIRLDNGDIVQRSPDQLGL